MFSRPLAIALALAVSCIAPAHAANIYGLKTGHPDLQSVSVLAFGPDGILFVGDPKAATIYAIATGDTAAPSAPLEDIESIDQKLASQLGVPQGSIQITDLAVNPETQHAYIAVEVQGQSPRIFSLKGPNELTELNLQSVPYSQAALPNAAEDKEVPVGRRKRNNRNSSITDLAFVNGMLIVSGLSNDQGASNVWELLFPFQEVDKGTPIEYYHGAHGRSEDYGPIRTFVPFIVNGEPNLLAGFVCTPLVKFPLSELKSGKAAGERVKGTTLAELGNRNQPLDMIAYQKDGQDYLLLSNSARGVMKISTENISRDEGIEEPIPDGKTAGQNYETIDALEGTVQMDKLDDAHALVIIKSKDGALSLKTVELP